MERLAVAFEVQASAATPLPPVDQRESYIGGSDAAAILGLDQYRTRLDVYREKMGEAELFAGNWATRRGSHLEPLLLQEYLAETGYGIAVTEGLDGADWSARHAELPYLGVHADAVVRTAKGKLRLVEFKTSRVAAEWKDGQAPDRAVAQVHHGAMVLRSHYPDELDTEADIYADIGERDGPVMRTVDLVPSALDWHCGEMVGFWEEHVLSRVAPEPQTAAECMARWPGTKGEVMEATPELVAVLEDYVAVRAQRDDAKAKLEHLKTIIHAKMGDAVKATIGSGKKAKVVASYPVCHGKQSFKVEKAKQQLNEANLILSVLLTEQPDNEALGKLSSILDSLIENSMVRGNDYRSLTPRL